MNSAGLNYSNIEQPYDNNMVRTASEDTVNEDGSVAVSGGLASAGSESDVNTDISTTQNSITGNSLTDVWLETWIKSRGYKPGVSGFMIDGRTGDIEAANLTLTGGQLRYGKTSFTDSTNSGYFLSSDGVYIGAASDTSKLKYTISTGTFDFVGTISSRETSTIASAINSSGNLMTNVINEQFDTSTKTILSDFTFGSTDYAGALKTGDITWNTSTGAITGGTGIVINKNGIIGALAGATKFSILTNGSATFAGDITGATGTFGSVTINSGTIQWATVAGTTNAPASNATVGATFGTNISGGSTGTNYVNNSGYITALTGNSITTGTLNASVCNVTNINADNISTGTLTGRTVQTATSGQRVVLSSSNYIRVYDTSNLRIELVADKLKFYNSSGTQRGELYATDTDMYLKNYSGGYLFLDAGSGYAVVIREGTTNVVTFSDSSGSGQLQMNGASSKVSTVECSATYLTSVNTLRLESTASPLTDNGSIYYSGTHFYGRLGGSWVQLDN